MDRVLFCPVLFVLLDPTNQTLLHICMDNMYPELGHQLFCCLVPAGLPALSNFPQMNRYESLPPKGSLHPRKLPISTTTTRTYVGT